MKSFLILQGPNLNLLGKREPEIYGGQSMARLHAELADWAGKRNLELDFIQSNHEGELIDALQQADSGRDGVVFNPGGFSHSSVALRDCIAGISLPVVEVHLSNIHARESFRRRSLTGGAARGIISGFGADVYKLALLQLNGL